MKNYFVLCLLAFALSPMTKGDELRFRPPVGHSDQIEQVALSPDGRWLATGSHDSTVRVWESATGRTSRVLSVAGDEAVRCVRWLSDNRRLLVGGDGSLRLWDAVAGKILHDWNFKNDPSAVKPVFYAFADIIPTSDDKQFLTLMSGGDGRAELWDLASGDLVRSYGNVPQGACIAFADGGKSVVASDYAGHLYRWDAATGKARGELETHCFAHQFSPDGHWLLATVSSDDAALLPAGVRDGQLVVLDAATGKLGRIVEEKAQLNTTGGNFSSDSRWVVVDDEAPGMHALEISTGRVVKPREEAARGIEVEAVEATPSKTNGLGAVVSFRADGKMVASSDGTISRTWSWPDFKPLGTFRGWNLNPDTAVITPDGRYAVITTTGQNTGALRFWDLASGRALRSLTYQGSVRTLIVSPDGKDAFFGTDEGKSEIRHWNLTTGALSPPFLGHEGTIFSLALSADGKTLLSCANDLTLRLWDVATGQSLKVIQTGAMSQKVGFNDQGNAMCLSWDALRTYDPQTGEKISENEIFQQKWAALPRADGFSTPDNYNAVFLNGGQTVLQALSYIKNGDGDVFTSIMERDCQTGKILRVFDSEVHDTSWGALAVSPDQKQFLTVDEATHHLKLWDMATGRALQTLADFGGADSFWPGRFALLPGGKLFLALQWDGTLRVRDLKTAKTVFSYLTLENGDWLAYTADGHFDGSPGGMEKVYFQQGNQTFGVEQFAERFYQPGLVELTLNGAGLAPSPNAATVLAQGAPPLVKITSPQAGVAPVGEIEVTVEARAQNGGGIKAIRLYHNGRLVGGPANLRSIVVEAAFPAANNGATVQTQKFSVTLAPGDNVLRAVAYSQADLESAPDNIILNWNAPPGAKPRLHILAIGVNAYHDATMNLAYARPDAEAMSAFFGANAGLFSEVKVTTLLDAEASGAAIKNALSQLAKAAAPDDVAVIYLAGHGETAAPSLALDKDEAAPQTFYFLPADADGMVLKEQVRRGGISGPTIDELVSKIPARKLWLIYDACKSGAALEGVTRAGASEQQALALLARAQGIYVLTAANGQQYANEVRALGHGILTYALLEGLKGKAADGAQTVRVRDLMNYTQSRVPALSREFRNRDQAPVVYGRGQNFPLVSKP